MEADRIQAIRRPPFLVLIRTKRKGSFSCSEANIGIFFVNLHP